MKKVYLFSGLGADQRALQKLDFPGFEVVFIKWIPPIKKESIELYAKRILCQIKCDNPILVGLSFGGMIAVEVAKQIEIEKIIVLSSVKNRKEIPLYYRLAGKLNLNKILPLRYFNKTKKINEWFFGVNSDEEKKLLSEILKDTDLIFLKWAVDKIVNWENLVNPKNCFHIHGNKDRILLLRNIHCDFEIEGGGHFMVLNKSEEINRIIKELLC